MFANGSIGTGKPVTGGTAATKFYTLADANLSGKGLMGTITTDLASISISKTQLDLIMGKSATLQVALSPTNARDNAVTWSSSNTKVASVKNGTVTAPANGTAIITVKVGAIHTKTATVTVGTTPKPTPKPIVTPKHTPKPMTQVEQFITRMYATILGRQPEEKGFRDNVNALVSKNQTAASIIVNFFYSPEFTQKNMSDSKYLDSAYRAIFNREPDPVGKATWLGALKDGCSRDYVLAGMLDSPEFRKMCTHYNVNPGKYEATQWRDKSREVSAFVTRMYRICLSREADAEGMEHWTKTLFTKANSGTQVAHGFLFSDEYSGKQRTKEAHIEHLYEVFLSRSSDPQGKANWLSNYRDESLNSKISLLNGFAMSEEFRRLCVSYNIDVGQPVPLQQ